MESKLMDLWNTKRWLFILLIPLIAVIVFKDVLISLLVGSARKVNQEAQAKDKTLESQAAELDKQAAIEKSKADQLASQVENRKENDIPEDWNKKK